MKLLIETPLISETKVIEEGNGKTLKKISGIWMQAEKENRNGRIYPRAVLEQAVREYQQDIAEKTSWGELDHPQDLDRELKRSSHLVTKLEMAGNDVYGEAVAMTSTNNGKILCEVIDIAGRVGVSSRGAGNIREVAGKRYVDEDFKLVAIDAVAKPSAHDAFVSAIREGEEYEYDELNRIFIRKPLIIIKEASLDNFFKNVNKIMRK